MRFILPIGALLIALLTLFPGHHAEAPHALQSTPIVVPDLDLSNSSVVSEPGCNATSFAQLPDSRSLFIGRQSITADGRLAGVSGPNDCSGGDWENEAAGKPYDRWGLVLDFFDWGTKQFHIVKPLIDTSLDPRTGRSRAMITGGRMRGLIIRSAYDASVARFGKNVFVAFECTFENGEAFHVEQTSSCLAVYDPVSRSIDMSRATVAVSGDRSGDAFYVASLPRLLSVGSKLYLYWAATTLKEGRIIRSAERGAELILNGEIPTVRGTKSGVAKPLDPASTEVWAPGNSPSKNLISNVMSFAPQSGGFLALGAIGGTGCQSPAGTSPGCFRLVIKRSSDPLAPQSFNKAQSVGTMLPTNAQEYALPVMDPNGRWWILGHFVRPLNADAARAPAPPNDFWTRTARQSVLILIPTRPSH